MLSNVPYREPIGRLARGRKPSRSLTKQLATDAVVSGSAASVASAAALMACSKLHEGSAAGGLNGPSQWLWGESEAYTREATLRHTLAGYAIHHATSIFWGVLHEMVFGGSPVLVTLVALIWGLSVIADSAQFSTCISELCDPTYIGTALTLQTSMGFLLTLVSIRLLPTVQAAVGWQWAFAFLAAGPLVGIGAMLTLRRSAAAVKLAGGRR